MDLSTLKPAPGSIKRNGKRIGRGQGSGKGGTSTKGHKGDQSRSGHYDKPGFEGGQMPLKLRVPKFGFKNRNRVEYIGVNLDVVEALAEKHNLTTLDHASFVSAGLLSNERTKVKILGRGELKTKLEIKANKFSATAKAAIEAAGGSAVTV